MKIDSRTTSLAMRMSQQILLIKNKKIYFLRCLGFISEILSCFTSSKLFLIFSTSFRSISIIYFKRSYSNLGIVIISCFCIIFITETYLKRFLFRCYKFGQVAQRQSIASARRGPRVRIPTGPYIKGRQSNGKTLPYLNEANASLPKKAGLGVRFPIGPRKLKK